MTDLRELDESMESDMTSIMETISDSEQESTEEVTPITTEEPKAEERARDPAGRFAKEDNQDSVAVPENAEEEGVPEAPSGSEGAAGGATEGATEEIKVVSQAPSTWRAAAKDKWATIDPVIQDEIIKRESDGHQGFQKGVEQYRNAADYAQRIDNIIEPYTQYMDQIGVSSEQMVGVLFNTLHRLTTGTPHMKAQLLMQIANEYGADMSQYTGASSTQVAPTGAIEAGAIEAGAPQENSRISAIEQQLRSSQQQQQQMEQQNQMVEQQNVEQSIESFRNELTPDGQVKNVFFDNVRELMADLVETSFRQNKTLALSDAYDQAIRINPETRAILEARNVEQALAKQNEEAALRAKSAQRAGQSNMPSSGRPSSEPANPVGSIEDTLRDTLAGIQQRG